MKRIVALIVSLALLLTTAGSAIGAKPVVSIDVLETQARLGDTVHFTYEYSKPLKDYGQYLLARLDCYANGNVLLSQYAIISYGDQDFFIGTTPSWTSGGANCEVRLKLLDYWKGEIDLRASDIFEVLP